MKIKTMSKFLLCFLIISYMYIVMPCYAALGPGDFFTAGDNVKFGFFTGMTGAVGVDDAISKIEDNKGDILSIQQLMTE